MKKTLGALCLSSLFALVGCGQNQGGVGSISGGADQTDGSIIGGSAVAKNTALANATVALYDTRSGGLCTSTILSDSILLTAAHCVHGARAQDLRVVFSNSISDSGAKIRNVSRYLMHAKYVRNLGQLKDTGDIALVKFEGGLPAGYRAAKLLQSAAPLRNGATVLLAGFGATNGAQHTGAGTLRHVNVKIENATYSATEVLLDQRQGKGACKGDSGGPAYISDGSSAVVFGVTSRVANDPTVNCGGSSVYTSVVAYKSWISAAAANLGVSKLSEVAAAGAVAAAVSVAAGAAQGAVASGF